MTRAAGVMIAVVGLGCGVDRMELQGYELQEISAREVSSHHGEVLADLRGARRAVMVEDRLGPVDRERVVLICPNGERMRLDRWLAWRDPEERRRAGQGRFLLATSPIATHEPRCDGVACRCPVKCVPTREWSTYLCFERCS